MPPMKLPLQSFSPEDACREFLLGGEEWLQANLQVLKPPAVQLEGAREWERNSLQKYSALLSGGHNAEF